jgi:hypothetical protein
MRVKGGGFGGVVSQNRLDQSQIDAGFQKMRGVRVTQSVNGDMLVQSKPWACFFKDSLDAFPADMANFGFGTGRRKQPGNRAVSFPKTPEHVEDGRRQWHVTIPTALAANVEQQTLSIDIADLQLHSLAHAQPTRIDGGKKDAVKGTPKAAEQLADFCPTHHRRNFVFPAWSRHPEHRPGTLERVLIEEFYGAESNGGVGARDLALVGEEEKVLANLFLGELIGWSPVMSGQQFYGRDINPLSGECEAVQLQVFNETLTERRHGVLSGKAGSNILGDGSLVGEIEPFLPESTLEKQLGQPRGTYPAGAGFGSTIF